MKTLSNVLMLFSLGTSILTQPLLASDIPIEGAFLCNIHFNRIAYDKSVKNVTAHLGVERNCRIFETTEPYWVDIQDVPLQLIADHDKFTGKAVLHFKSSTYQPCDSKPMVQFWIAFEDGTTKVENPITAEVTDSLFIADREGPTAEACLESVHGFRQEPLSRIETVSCTEILSYGDASSHLIDH